MKRVITLLLALAMPANAQKYSSRSSSAPRVSAPAPRASTPKPPSTSKYSSSSSGIKSTPSAVGSKSGFGSKLYETQAKQASADAYKATKPKETPVSKPKTPVYSSVQTPNKPTTASATQQRSTNQTRTVVHEHHVYEARQRNFYDGIQPSYGHTDRFSPYLIGYLFAKMTEPDRTVWAYHHWDELDQRRRQELLNRDSKLEARIKQLEHKIPRDPDYVGPGFTGNEDLMYASLPPHDPVELSSGDTGTNSQFSLAPIFGWIFGWVWWAIKWTAIIAIGVIAIGWTYWFVFVRQL